MSIVGARPNFVKMAPVIKNILTKKIDHVFVHTGQHYDREMSRIFLQELDLPAVDYYLNVGSGTHAYQTGQMLIKLEKVISKENPDIVIVPGDTNTTLAGALSAVKLHIPVAHLEAGLRSFDKKMPEEINRILIDHCSDYLFCPTKTAVNNLKHEGISDEKIYLTGDTMVESCFQNLEIAQKKSKIFERINIKKKYFLATVHRAENTDDKKKLENIIKSFLQLERQIVFPIHPRTIEKLKKYGLLDKLKNSNIFVMRPVGYIDFLLLLSRAKLVLTDSGGTQKEAFLLNKPCVTLRNNTEWVETIKLGRNILVGAETIRILNGVEIMLNKKLERVKNPFGDRKVSERIVNIILSGR